ncbi:MAG: serine hydrolase domain-containing protein [Pseudomonadota bacterium]
MIRTGFFHAAAVVLLIAARPSAMAQELPAAKPESVGMSSERLARIDAVIQRHIAAGTLANAVTLVMRDGKVVQNKAYGQADPAKGTALRIDALFYMVSSSKPITAVAVLMLVEEGLVRLDDPVSRFIPEFKGQRVAVAKPGVPLPPPLAPGAAPAGPKPEADYVPAAHDITVRDLLTHTSGLNSGGLGTLVSADIQRKPTDRLADFVPQLGKVALDFQPGTRWSYSAASGFEILSRIVEIASGKSYDAFLKERVFGPLGMNDTGFVVPADKQARMLPFQRRNAQGLWTVNPPPPITSEVYFSGATGLISTARDYARFEQMLLNGGQLDGKRLLAPRTVELMRTNQVGDLYHGMRGNENGMGFGLGVSVTLDETRAVWPRSNGSAGWYGAFGTLTWNDPREGIVGVLMIQQPSTQVQSDFGNAVMQSITTSRPRR